MATNVEAIPLIPRIIPCLQTIFFKRIWAKIPEKEVPTVKNRLVMMADIGENPISNRTGVRIKPPPTPKKPERILIRQPSKK